ncbi:MAG: hypothetical protein COB98_05270 [Flavobacteriaceae bacterium]|nr:MAG: hypothetical protein COB98_05270 [Flavobacteriaceae bacterium]
MTREDQLMFCKRCSSRELDLKQGLICSLTGEKATFVDECMDFEEDRVLIALEKKKREAIRPNQKRAELAQLLIAIVLLFEIISIGSSYMQYTLLQSVNRGEFIPEEVFTINDTREQIIGILYTLVSIISAVTFIQWFRRGYYNLSIRTRCDLENKWALIAWFIPVISIFRPYQIMKEMWQETSRMIALKFDGFNTYSSLIIGVWWTLWVISNYIAVAVLKGAIRSKTIADLIDLTIADAVLSFIGIPLALLTIFMIRNYALREEKLNEIEGIDL